MRSLASAFILTITMSVSAAILTPNAALQRAMPAAQRLASTPTGISTHQNATTKNSPTSVDRQPMTLRHTIKASDNRAAIYIFGADRGEWLVVSADDVVQPLLGRLDEAPAPGIEIPVQMRQWLETVADNIMEQRDATTLATTADEYDRESVTPLVSRHWDQSKPFNNLCPILGTNGERALTGCVATALAQIMATIRYPAASSGSATASGFTMNLNQSYDYSKMLDSYGSSYTAPQANEMAKLMAAAGYAVKMQYGLTASAAYSEDVVEALTKHFGFDHPQYIASTAFSRTQWEEMLYENISQGYPVYYAGADRDGGHAFVCDGYDRGYFHFNWGWSGNYDGFFLLDGLSSNAGYVKNQRAVINIVRPDDEYQGVEMAPSLQMHYLENPTIEDYGDKYPDETTVNGWYSNLYSTSAEWNVGVIYENIDNPADIFRQTLKTNSTVKPGYWYYLSWNHKNASTWMKRGITYKVYLAASMGNEPLEPMTFDRSSTPGYFLLSRDNDGIMKSTLIDVRTARATLSESSYTLFSGLSMTVSGSLRNDNGDEINHILRPAIVDSKTHDIIADGCKYCAWLQPGESKEFVITGNFKPRGGMTLSNGQYHLALLADGLDTPISDYVPITVAPTPSFKTVTVNSFTSRYADNTVPCNDFTFDIDMMQPAEGYYNFGAQIILYLMTNGKSYTKHTTLSIPFTLMPGERRTVEACFEPLPSSFASVKFMAQLYTMAPIIGNTMAWTQAKTLYGIVAQEASGINEVTDDISDDAATIYRLDGSKPHDSSTLTPGIYILRQGSRAHKIVIK